MCRLRLTIEKMNNELKKIHQQTKEMSDSSVKYVLNNCKLGESQKTIIHEIITASKAENPKCRRYSEDWILLCVLLKIR